MALITGDMRIESRRNGHRLRRRDSDDDQVEQRRRPPSRVVQVKSHVEAAESRKRFQRS